MKLFSSRLSRRFILNCVGVTLISVLAVGFWSEKLYRQKVVADIHSQLEATASLLVSRFPDGFSESNSAELERIVQNVGKANRTRITLIRPDGVVAADSERPASSMENHRERPEVLSALAHHFGESTRFSHTIGTNMFYFAQTIGTADRTLGIVRVAVPRERVEQRLLDFYILIAGSFLLSGFASFVIAAGLAREISNPVATMIRVIREIKKGNLRNRVKTDFQFELRQLSEEINQMADELERRTRTVQEEKQKLELSASALLGGVITIDQSDAMVFWNDAALQFLEWADLPTPGRRLFDLIRVSALSNMVDETRRQKTTIGRDVHFFNDNHEKILMVHTIPCALAGGEGVMIVMYDKTNVHQLERARQDFVANASHELKTPLTAIKGYVDTLIDGADQEPETRKKFLTQLSSNVNRLAALADDLLDLAKIESRDENFEKAQVDLGKVITSVADHYRPLAEKKGLRLGAHVPTSNVHVATNRYSLDQILSNLVDNAIKYTNAPGEIDVNLLMTEDEARIDVTDTGIGIAKSDVDRVFERFYRVDKARSIEAGGTGLGLSIVKHLVAQLNSRVELESELGRGSRFSVFLPRS